ncbi:MAG TPA: HIT family protein [Afifellaceae bacterium]|nr:HIT family protein [Afifellaceae bacterium]
MAADYDDQNVFAKILRGEMPAHKVLEDEHTLAIMDIMPRADGHALVLPKAPSRNFFDIAPDDLAWLMAAVQKVARAARQAFHADGITIQQFNESAGGQVIFHTHVHVLPRVEGVALRPHTGEMENDEVLKANAEKLRRALQA